MKIFTLNLILLLLSTIAYSQRTFVVAKKHPNASDKNAGTHQFPFHTINKAALVAGPGDTVVVHAGTYRERIAPAKGGEAEKPVIYRVANREEVIVKGSDVWNPSWRKVGDHIYFGAFDEGIFTTELDESYGFEAEKLYFNPYQEILRKSPSGLKLSLGQLFIEGKKMLEVDTITRLEQIPGSWMVREDKKGLLVHFPFSENPETFSLIELTTRSRVFAPYKRGLAHIHINGFTFEHGATNFPSGFWTETGSPQAGIVSCRGGNHWKIEKCIVRYGKSLGLDIGSEGPIDYDGLNQEAPEGSGYHTIQNNHISDNGCGGIAGYVSHESKIIGNRIERNNALGFTAPEIGGIKLHFFTGGLIEGNIVKDNHAYGIWLDNEWHNSRVTRNVIVANEKAGIFMELGYGPVLIDNNFIAFSKGYSGFGLYSHDASGITFAHNMVYFNAGFGLWAHVATDRKKDLPFDEISERVQIEASNWRVLNNLFIGNASGAISFPYPSTISENNLSDYNVVTGGYNRISYETFAESLDVPYFLVNSNKGRITFEDTNQNVLTGENASSPKEEIPFITFPAWQKITKNDTHSAFAQVLRPEFSAERLQLSFYIDDMPSKINCASIAGIERDFFGNLLPENPKAGPFQSLKYEPLLQDRSKSLEFRGPYNHIRDDETLNVFLLKPYVLGKVK
ncbi:MAG: right-handed parallel beta-helix repeat-containing protein [Bacteroidota bacterium]